MWKSALQEKGTVSGKVGQTAGAKSRTAPGGKRRKGTEHSGSGGWQQRLGRTWPAWPALLVAVATSTLSGCAGDAARLPVDPGDGSRPCHGEAGSVAVQYLGIEGYLIHWRGRDLLTAPMFSNPRALTVVLWRIRANPERIDRYLPPADAVDDILVSHAHYDHLLDVPYIALEKAPEARVFGSETAANILRAVLPEERIVSVRSTAARGSTPGKWHVSRSGVFRFMAIESEHAPNIDGYTFYTGHIDEPLERLPRTGAGWKAGTTYAYLIDLLHEDGTVAFRIHFQDAASTPPAGFIPDLAPADQGPVDLAITCVPGSDNVTGHPQGVLQHLQPRYVLLGHWENLFAEPTRERARLRVAPGTDVPAFIKRLESALPQAPEWVLPQPLGCFCYEPRAGTGNGEARRSEQGEQ